MLKALLEQIPAQTNVDRFEYFSYIFEHLSMATMEALDALLPWT